MRNLEVQMGQIAQQLAKPTQLFPSDTIPNSKEECKAISLRSEKMLEKEEEEETHTAKLRKEALEGNKMQEEYVTPFFKKIQINIPFAEALEQVPLYAKFIKELISKKRNWRENETVVLTKEYSAIIQKNFLEKLNDPGSFVIPCIIGKVTVERALCDIGVSINLMSLSLMRKQQIEEVKSTKKFLQLADRSLKFSLGVVENLLVKVGTFIFPADFVILDMEEDVNASIILRRPFLAIGRALIDVQKGELTLKVNDEQIVLNVFKALQHPNDYADCMKIDIIDPLVQEALEEEDLNESLESSIEVEVGEIKDCTPPKEA
ncbi:uncharacterized protein LOC130977460 [Arachis stenosperma]|uniref:uncharacterized protein LOC130977460 n=1 Tax=Arachis stenosperma TaxID=217475 RepID=UPI0025AB60CE|nr:uncharacterized protein LOC130977460 [Arachis stenosperma]